MAAFTSVSGQRKGTTQVQLRLAYALCSGDCAARCMQVQSGVAGTSHVRHKHGP